MTVSDTLVLSDGTTYQGTLRYNDMGEAVVEMATCGYCQFTWNDELITSITPTPSARCPNEYNHVHNVVLWLAGSQGKRVGRLHGVRDMYDGGCRVLTMCGLRRPIWNRAVTSERTLAVPVNDNRTDCYHCAIATHKKEKS